MIPDWAKSLLVKIFIGAVLMILLVQGAIAAGIDVTTPDAVSFSFGPSAEATQMSSFRITNTGINATQITLLCSPPSGSYITITPSKTNFDLDQGRYKDIDLTINVDPDRTPEREDPPYSCTITVRSTEEEKSVYLEVSVIYNAKIKVSRSSINFGEVPSKEHQKVSEPPIKISEEYGYKRLEGVLISPASGNENNWVTVGSYPSQISKDKPVDVTFTLTPGPPNYERDDNRYTWKFIITSSNADPVTITVEARIMRPPKLGRLDDEELEIKFDEPKGTVSRYVRDIDVRVRNEGDETMQVSSSVSQSPGGGISINIVDSPRDVTGKSSETLELRVVAPYNAPEGTYHGKVYVDAGAAGRGTVDITIVIKWPVDFFISATSIDFGSIELKERGYETKQVDITFTEYYLYKPVRNLRFSATGEYGNWLKEELDFAEIPPGESRTVTLTIAPGLEAVPKDYVWTYNIGASEIAAKHIGVKAKIIPLNITKVMEGLRSFRGTPLYTNYPSSESIIANGIAMLEVVESSEIGADDWEKIPVLMTGTLSLLSSLNDGIVFTEAANYGEAVESLSAASVSTATLAANSDLNNGAISGYAEDISVEADNTTKGVLMDEAKLLELRGWTLKKAVEHALAIDDIGALNDEENVLEAALSYQYAAMLYGLLNNKEKRLENVYEGSVLMDRHDELVSDATDLRLRAETSIATSKEDDLTRIWDTYLLFNLYHYDTFVTSYRTAEGYLEEASQKYKVAGERFLYDQTEGELNRLKSEMRFILSLFFIACGLYGVLFLYVITRIIGGSMAYMRDVYEREVGDILVT